LAVKFRDYYEVLGVPRSASPEEIKRAYRRQARKHHPDLQPPGERAKANETIQLINEAYEVLSDPEKRKKYDALGEHWKSGMDFAPPPGASPGGPSGAWGETHAWGDAGAFSDFFESLFGGASAGRGARGRGRGRGADGGIRFSMAGGDVEAELPVTLDELLREGRRRIHVGDRSLDVRIPVGARDGNVLRLSGQGEPGIGGGPSGDLFLRLRLEPDPRYRASGDDLEMDLKLWPWQAVLGTSVRIETPDGPVALKIPPKSASGQRLRLRDRGLPRADGTRGSLFATLRIVVPREPSEKERQAYEDLKRAATSPEDRPAEDG